MTLRNAKAKCESLGVIYTGRQIQEWRLENSWCRGKGIWNKRVREIYANSQAGREGSRLQAEWGSRLSVLSSTMCEDLHPWGKSPCLSPYSHGLSWVRGPNNTLPQKPQNWTHCSHLVSELMNQWICFIIHYITVMSISIALATGKYYNNLSVHYPDR